MRTQTDNPVEARRNIFKRFIYNIKSVYGLLFGKYKRSVPK